jgi:hypothetical protein
LSWCKVASWGFWGINYPKIAGTEWFNDPEVNDGDMNTSKLFVFWVNSSLDLVWDFYDEDLPNGTQLADGTGHNLGLDVDVRTIVSTAYYALADTTNPQFYISLDASNTFKQMLVFDQAGAAGGGAQTPSATRATTLEFDRAKAKKFAAFAYDSTAQQYCGIDAFGNMYRYGGYSADRSIQGKYAWYDADVSGGSTTHETLTSPTKTFTVGARGYLSASTPPPPDALNTDPLNLDKANQVRLYLSDDGGTTWKLQTLAGDPWSILLPSLDALTVATPDVGTPFPTTLTPGDVKSAASDAGIDGFSELIHLRGDGAWRLGNYSSVRHFGTRSKASNQSIPASTPTVVTFGTAKEAATGLTWDNTNSQWIVAKPGVYSVQASIEWDNTSVAAGSHREVGIFKNGTNYAWTDWSSAGFIGTLNTMTQPIALMVPCVTGDTIQCRVFTSGAAPVIGGDDSRTWLSCAFVSQ